jgi:hypothetical protein
VQQQMVPRLCLLPFACKITAQKAVWFGEQLLSAHAHSSTQQQQQHQHQQQGGYGSAYACIFEHVCKRPP